MKALARIAATMAALGISPGDASLLSRMGLNRKTVSKHTFNRTSRGAGRRSKAKRLHMARGAGSINAKADILQLCRAGKWEDAATMDQDHERRCGEQLFGPEIRAQWRSYAVEEALTPGE
jgi:hypothetical protein